MPHDSETSQAFEKTLKGPTVEAVTRVQRRAMSSFIILLIVPGITSHISRRPISVLFSLAYSLFPCLRKRQWINFFRHIRHGLSAT